MAEIYALIDPRDGEVRYVGKANNSAKRLKQHLRETRRDYPLYRWIAKLRGMGMTPVMNVIAACPQDQWREVEKREISEARKSSKNLLNVADGGDEPFCSKEVRADNGRKNSIARVSTPFKSRVYELKRMIGSMLARGELKERHIEKMRLAAKKCPELFGAWATL